MRRCSDEEDFSTSGPQTVPGIIAVSDRHWDLSFVLSLRSKYAGSHCFYLLSNQGEAAHFQQMQRVCSEHGIHCILPYRTASQIIDDIVRYSSDPPPPPARSQVVAILGALPQSGVTTSVLHLAARLAELADIRIGILGMNGWNPGDAGIPYTAKYLDELWGAVHSKQLTAAELPSKMQQVAPKVHYLAGSRDLKRLYYYQPEGAAWLIECACKSFDLLLLDAGSYPDHALAAQSIHACDRLLVQLGQSVQAKAQWLRTREQLMNPVFAFPESKLLLWFNRMHRTAEDLENERQLSEQLRLPYIGALPYDPSFLRMEADRRLLRMSLSTDYQVELDKVCRWLIDLYKLPARPLLPSAIQNNTVRWSWLRRWRTANAGGIGR
ncbi:hypothetical protein [Paenibacillus silviterrae]|uniref:hypothetical protein n=1 Tax=Paenibacillus silviterrae TaxID=3242194 RepID=UPI0025428418|nr:hypothetical protein [Paenibacillus chinjuensis]